MEFDRITTDPEKMAGAPSVRDLRFPVASIVAMIADGISDTLVDESSCPTEALIVDSLRTR